MSQPNSFSSRKSCSPYSMRKSSSSASVPHAVASASQHQVSLRLPLPTGNLIGTLHSAQYSFEQLLELPTSVYGRYELESGKLVAKPMPSKLHDDVIALLFLLFAANYMDVETNYRIVFAPHVILKPCSPRTSSNEDEYSSSSSEHDSRRYFEPDLAIGIPRTEDESANTSPQSRKVSFGTTNPPEVVIEVTSGNRNRDLEYKPMHYARTKIAWYIIIDLDLPHQSTSTYAPCVRVGKLRRGRYEWQIYNPGEECFMPFFGRQKVDNVLNPKDTMKDLRQKVERIKEETLKAKEETLKAKEDTLKAKQKTAAAEKRAADVEKRLAEAEKRAAEAMKKALNADKNLMTEKRKKRKLKEMHKELAERHGEPVRSDSSSGTSGEGGPSRNRPKK